jgi:hypothetical protein
MARGLRPASSSGSRRYRRSCAYRSGSSSPSSLPPSQAGLRLFSATARDRGPRPQATQPPARRGSTRTRAPRVSHGDFPQHLDDLLAAFLVELGAKHAGEPVEIDGVVLADLASRMSRRVSSSPSPKCVCSKALSLRRSSLATSPSIARAWTSNAAAPAAIPPRANSPRALQGE